MLWLIPVLTAPSCCVPQARNILVLLPGMAKAALSPNEFYMTTPETPLDTVLPARQGDNFSVCETTQELTDMKLYGGGGEPHGTQQHHAHMHGGAPSSGDGTHSGAWHGGSTGEPMHDWCHGPVRYINQDAPHAGEVACGPDAAPAHARPVPLPCSTNGNGGVAMAPLTAPWEVPAPAPRVPAASGQLPPTPDALDTTPPELQPSAHAASPPNEWADKMAHAASSPMQQQQKVPAFRAARASSPVQARQQQQQQQAPAQAVPEGPRNTSPEASAAAAAAEGRWAAQPAVVKGPDSRPRLRLLPRSTGAAAAPPAASPPQPHAHNQQQQQQRPQPKASIFGDARPREDVLRARGVDPASVDLAAEEPHAYSAPRPAAGGGGAAPPPLPRDGAPSGGSGSDSWAARGAPCGGGGGGHGYQEAAPIVFESERERMPRAGAGLGVVCG